MCVVELNAGRSVTKVGGGREVDAVVEADAPSVVDWEKMEECEDGDDDGEKRSVRRMRNVSVLSKVSVRGRDSIVLS